MNEFLSRLLQAVIIAAVPVCVTYACKGFKALAVYISTKTDNETVKRYLADATEAISTAVTYTSQTYVDGLKKSDSFTEANQKEAMNKAIEKAKALLTTEVRAFLEKTYGDLNEYLRTRIEAEVRTQKQAEPLLLGEAITAEAKESPDVTVLAASTAAATAASVVQKSIEQTTAALEAATDKGSDPLAAGTSESI